MGGKLLQGLSCTVSSFPPLWAVRTFISANRTLDSLPQKSYFTRVCFELACTEHFHGTLQNGPCHWLCNSRMPFLVAGHLCWHNLALRWQKQDIGGRRIAWMRLKGAFRSSPRQHMNSELKHFWMVACQPPSENFHRRKVHHVSNESLPLTIRPFLASSWSSSYLVNVSLVVI